ncbi:MAG: dTMP kinase [Gorillibacterium sp.]|nr:dTMP kinase [Gorillibacterium sp.]
MKGIFITFEGPDGSGKTTQLRKLGEELLSRGYPVLMTREPGGTFISDKVRAIILDPENKAMADTTEVLLYAASRAQHVQEKIIPALKAGMVVLCDRFVDASVAYQAFGLGVDRQMVEAINLFATTGLEPIRSYLLDVPVEVSLQRLEQRASGLAALPLDRIERKSATYHQKVRDGFHVIVASSQERVVLVKGDRSQEVISADILADCLNLLGDRV